MKLTYYSQTLRLLGVEPRLSPRAVAAVERTEALRGVPLPAAVREFYTLDGVAARLARPGWCAAAVPLGEFLRRFREVMAEARAGDAADPCVRFYQDARGPVRVFLDGSDDPPTDSSGPYPDHGLTLPEGQYLSFSGFVRCAAWAWSAQTDRHHTAWVGLDPWPGEKGQAGPPHLDFLIERYEEWGRLTPQPDSGVDHEGAGGDHHSYYCFFGPSVRIQLRTIGDATKGVVPACWWLYADTEAALFDLYAELWPAHGVPVDVEDPDCYNRRRPRMRFRKRFPTATLTPP